MARSILRAGKVAGAIIVAVIVVAVVLYSAGVLTFAQGDPAPVPDRVLVPGTDDEGDHRQAEAEEKPDGESAAVGLPDREVVLARELRGALPGKPVVGDHAQEAEQQVAAIDGAGRRDGQSDPAL